MEEQSQKRFLRFPRQRKSYLHLFLFLTFFLLTHWQDIVNVPHLQRAPRVSFAISRCQQLQLKAGPPPDFYDRTHSDRFVPGTKPVLLKHARIWTGGQNGTEVVLGDILMDKGLIKSVGRVPRSTLNAIRDDLVTIDAKNAWVTPGIIDMHSHIGNFAVPELAGASEDYNSDFGNIQVGVHIVDSLQFR